MSKTVLKVENLSKLYRLGEVGTGTISDDLKRWWFRMRGKEDPFKMVGQTNTRSGKSQSDYVWALKDINFEVQQGEVLGIIGKNGAGKSTLLKILSRITGPTDGKIQMKGRVASLLEVGTGMHPDLTAKENIYLNGAILGMTKQEIKKKFDEIIDFAGISMFVNTPVKRFSSGMRVRIGFAVAAFLEPEILIVDEVLAVGDAEFQKKAIGKMKDVSREDGRTVLFVSHNMASVLDLCDTGMLLKDGSVDFYGSVRDTVSKYLGGDLSTDNKGNIKEHKNRYGNGDITFSKVRVLNNKGKVLETCETGTDIIFDMYLDVNKSKPIENLHVSITLTDNFGRNLMHFSTAESTEGDFTLSGNEEMLNVQCKINNIPLAQDTYFVNFFVSDLKKVFDEVIKGYSISIEQGNFFGNGKIKKSKLSPILHPGKWNLISE